MKLQTPNSKLQRNLKLQIPSDLSCALCPLELGIWKFSEVWSLEFAVSTWAATTLHG